METCDLPGANRTVVTNAKGLGQWVRSLWWFPDGRIIYSQAEAADLDANLWQTRVDPDTGAPTGTPKRLTRWIGCDVRGLSGNADGTRLVLQKESYPSQVYIGELGRGAKRVRPPLRVTNDESVDWATAWTADSKAALFTSDRGGKWSIFKQRISDDRAQPLIQGRESANLVTPQCRWLMDPLLGKVVDGSGPVPRVPADAAPCERRTSKACI